MNGSIAPGPPRAGDAALDPVADRAAELRRRDRRALWLLFPLLAVFLVSYLVFVVVFQVATVSGPSMLPTLRTGDVMLVTKGSSGAVRGDVVLIEERDSQGSEELVKRIVGVGGDTIEVRDGVAYVNGAREEGHPGVYTDPGTFGPVTVPAGSVFVMGDERAVSIDSRSFGPVPTDAVIGRVFAIVLPVWRARIVPR